MRTLRQKVLSVPIGPCNTPEMLASKIVPITVVSILPTALRPTVTVSVEVSLALLVFKDSLFLGSPCVCNRRPRLGQRTPGIHTKHLT